MSNFIAMRYIFLVLGLVMFVSCSNNKKKPVSEIGGEAHYLYKRYTGTIAGQQVVLNLYLMQQDSNSAPFIVSGNYFYRGKSQVIDLELTNEEAEGDVTLSESVETDIHPGADEPYWQLGLLEDGVDGWWNSADGKTKHKIELQEDYKDAYSFIFFSGADSAFATSKKYRYKVGFSYNFMSQQATKGIDYAFIDQAVGLEMDGDSMDARNIYDYVQLKKKKTFRDYREMMATIINNDEEQHNDRHNWENKIAGFCRYNDRGVLVYEVRDFSITQGNILTVFKYISMDARNRKVFHLADVMTIDTPVLQQLLTDAAKKYNNPLTEAPIADKLLVEAVPPTENFALSDVGIVFYYNVEEITHLDQGKISLFVPYTAISSMLLPQFKERMNLSLPATDSVTLPADSVQ